MSRNILYKFHPEPVFVGGFPGSGTRVISRILSACGIYMGSRLNTANGSVYFADFLDHWVAEYIASPGYEMVDRCDEMEGEFHSCLNKHLEGVTPEIMWGSKNPRNILILPFLCNCFPAMKFIHVLRDGRDLAASSKERTLVRQYSQALIGREVVTAADMVELWSTISLRGYEQGKDLLPDNYLLVKYEDLCRSPHEVIHRISRFSGRPLDDARLLVDEINPPSNAIGRW